MKDNRFFYVDRQLFDVIHEIKLVKIDGIKEGGADGHTDLFNGVHVVHFFLT